MQLTSFNFEVEQKLKLVRYLFELISLCIQIQNNQIMLKRIYSIFSQCLLKGPSLKHFTSTIVGTNEGENLYFVTSRGFVHLSIL